MIYLTVGVVTLAGAAFLCASLRRYQRAFFRDYLTDEWAVALRSAGTLGLIGGFMLAIRDLGIGIGSTAFLASLAVATIVVAAMHSLLARRPRRAPQCTHRL